MPRGWPRPRRRRAHSSGGGSALKPVAIFRYARTEGPGHFATFLAEHGLEFTLVRLDEGEPVPDTSEAFSGLGFMGGPMSANDQLPWTQRVLSPMPHAVPRGV